MFYGGNKWKKYYIFHEYERWSWKNNSLCKYSRLFADQGKKILLIDIDPQMNATQYLLNPQNIQKVIDDKYTEKETIYWLYKDSAEDDLYGISGEEPDSVSSSESSKVRKLYIM